MKLYVSTDHDGHYPVGVASLVLATGEIEARCLLDAELKKRGLKAFDLSPYTLSEVTILRGAVILNDGDY